MRTFLLMVTGLLMVSMPATAVGDPSGACVLIPLKFGPGNSSGSQVFRSPSGRYEVLFQSAGAAPSAPPDSFQVYNLQTKKNCTGTAGVNTDVYISRGEDVLAAVAYSRDAKVVEFLSLDSCKSLARLTATQGKVEVEDNRITIHPSCQCSKKLEEFCNCEPAQIYALQGDGCRPVHLKDDSLILTRKTLRVEITKPSIVAEPKTRKARFIAEK